MSGYLDEIFGKDKSVSFSLRYMSKLIKSGQLGCVVDISEKGFFKSNGPKRLTSILAEALESTELKVLLVDTSLASSQTMLDVSLKGKQTAFKEKSELVGDNSLNRIS